MARTLAKELANSECDVLAIDDKDENIQEIAEKVTYAVRADVREPGILKSLGVQNVDVAIIAVAENMEASITATMQAKELGVPLVLDKGSKFSSWTHPGENRSRSGDISGTLHGTSRCPEISHLEVSRIFLNCQLNLVWQSFGFRRNG